MSLVTMGYVCLHIVASSRREADSRNGLEVSPNGSHVNRSATQNFLSEVYSILYQRNSVASLSSSDSIS
ncbi:hypothetical protein TNCT_249021 [Trichonephila clavata]|uniref:Uncharacterized protein n=1 Tax=Trichonephila clavata TaxID=2740835 RepID=A0A8X6FDG7_TRICU|nr:hypothetical protein TNCT_249021 [Trichonephila clavata]